MKRIYLKNRENSEDDNEVEGVSPILTLAQIPAIILNNRRVYYAIANIIAISLTKLLLSSNNKLI